MDKLTKLALQFATVMAVLLLFASAAQSQPGFRLTSDKGFVKVPFDFYWNGILVQTRINNSEPVWLAFDTGAAVNVINEDLVKRLGLTARGTADLTGGGGMARGAIVENATLGLAGVEASKQTIAVIPLGLMAAYTGRDVQGLIGTPFILNFVVEIDYVHRTLTFYDRKTYNLANEPDAIELVEHGGVPYIKVEMTLTSGNTVTDLFEIDTGSNAILSINRPFAEAHKLMSVITKEQMAEGVGGAGIGGDMKAIDARIQSLRIGKYTLNRPVIHISQDTAGVGVSADAGFIGGEIFRRFTLVLDYQSHKVLLKPNAGFREPFEVDMSGLELMTKPGDFHVIQIKKIRAGFPAAAAGLREGDIITAINGRPASQFNLSQLVKMFMREGRQYALTIRRGDQTMRVKLKMKRAV